MFPNNGRGFGPGGKDARETLGFRNQRKRAMRRLGRATEMAEVVMRAGRDRKWGDIKEWT